MNEATCLTDADIRQHILEDILAHSPGWGEDNIVADLEGRLKIDAEVTRRIIGQMVDEKLIEKDKYNLVSMPPKKD